MYGIYARSKNKKELQEASQDGCGDVMEGTRSLRSKW